jgi:hypothetical protein
MSEWTVVTVANHHHDDGDGDVRRCHSDRSLVPVDDSGRVGKG